MNAFAELVTFQWPLCPLSAIFKFVVCGMHSKFWGVRDISFFQCKAGWPSVSWKVNTTSLSFERVIEPCLQWVPFVCSAHASHFLERNGLPANDISVLKAAWFLQEENSSSALPFPLGFTFNPCSVQCTDQHTFRQLLISTSFDDLGLFIWPIRSRLEECGGTGSAVELQARLALNCVIIPPPLRGIRPFPIWKQNKKQNETKQNPKDMNSLK